MKKIALVIGLLVLASLCVRSQTAVEKADGAEVTFEETTHDYGTLTQGGDGNCVFKFKNTGNEPLILSDVRKSCGCTTPTWSKEPILPGQSGVINVGYNTNNVGQFSKNITVISNATNATVVLTIKGTVTATQ